MYCHDWEEYSVNKGKNDQDFQIMLHTITEKNEQRWNLVTRNKMTATQIIEKNYFVGSKIWQMKKKTPDLTGME